MWERYERTDGMFPRAAFIFDAECNVYICPNGHLLRTSGTVHDGRVRNYLPQPGDCRTCELKARCTRAPFRKIARDINEEARDYVFSLSRARVRNRFTAPPLPRLQTNPDIGASRYPLSIRRPDFLAGRADEDEQFGTHSKPWDRSDALHGVAARETHEGGCAVGHRR